MDPSDLAFILYTIDDQSYVLLVKVELCPTYESDKEL